MRRSLIPGTTLVLVLASCSGGEAPPAPSEAAGEEAASPATAAASEAAGSLAFEDDFESGDTGAWQEGAEEDSGSGPDR